MLVDDVAMIHGDADDMLRGVPIKKIIGNQVMAEAAATLKKHEFNIPARRNFGLGMSLMITHNPEPFRYYVEEATETALTCERCTLQYTIYGVFAFCPDCAAHNSLQILKRTSSEGSSIS